MLQYGEREGESCYQIRGSLCRRAEEKQDRDISRRDVDRKPSQIVSEMFEEQLSEVETILI